MDKGLSMGNYFRIIDLFYHYVWFRYMVDISIKKEKLSRTKKIILQKHFNTKEWKSQK